MFHRSIAGEPYWTVSTDGAAVPSSRLRPATASSPIHRAASTRLICPCATRMTGPPGQSGRGPGQDAVGAGGDGLRALAVPRAVRPERPAGYLLADLATGHALVVAVVPLGEVGIDQVHGQPGQLRRLERAGARAAQHESRVHAVEDRAQRGGLVGAERGQ